MGKIHVVEHPEPAEKTLRLEVAGKIDEDAEFPAIESQAIDRVVVDLDDVTYINSCGTRTWIGWVNAIPRKLHVEYERCPVVMVHQMNLINGFLPNGSLVRSFYVPYYCAACDRSETVLFVQGRHFSGAELIPKDQLCPGCGKPMAIDVMEGMYFKFLSRR